MSAHPLNESAFLKMEALKAKTAATRSLKMAKAALSNSMDPRVATRKHPLIAIATAALAGFFGTVAAIPSKEERELRHLERLRKALNPEPDPKPPQGANTSSNGAAAEIKPTLWMIVLREVFAFAKPILLAQISSHLRAETVQHESDGATPPTDVV